MGQETFALSVGALLSFLFEYVPGVKTWFDGLDAVQKRLFMLFLCLVTGGVAVILSCYTSFSFVECSESGVMALVETVILAIVGNQSTHSIIKK